MRWPCLLLVVLGCTSQEEAPEPPVVAALHEQRIDDALELLRARVKSGARIIDPVTLNRGYRGFVPDPDDTTDWDRDCRQALRHLEAGEYWRASRLLRKALRTDPKNGLPLIYQGLADLKQGDAWGACQSFERGSARGDEWIADIGHVVALHRLGRVEEADNKLHAVTDSLTEAHRIHAYYLARMAMTKGDVNGAEYFLAVWDR